VDIKIKKVTGHPSGLTKSTLFTNYTYTIADFVGEDLNVEDIRSVFIEVWIESGNNRTVTFYNSMPWDPTGTTYVGLQIWHTINSGGGKLRHKTLLEVPINKDQASFKIYAASSDSDNSFFTSTIIAVREISL